MRTQTLPGLFISHGSPMLAINPESVGPALHRLASNLPKPHAIVVMSAHWESRTLEVSVASRPETWHDFRGFPEALYQLRYPAPGHLTLAEEILQRCSEAHIDAHANNNRPRDHGVWIPLLQLYPQADIPVVQLSLPKHMSSHELYRLGQCLAPLRDAQILIIGSGSLTHNLSMLDFQPHATTPKSVLQFRNHVAQALQHQDYEAVLNWRSLPFIFENHPTLEHLSPLFLSMGTGLRCSVVHSSFSMAALSMDIYRFD